MFKFKFSKIIPILCLLFFTIIVLTSRLLIDKRESFLGNAILGFSDAPSRELVTKPEFGVGDNYSYQTQPPRSQEYVDLCVAVYDLAEAGLDECPESFEPYEDYTSDDFDDYRQGCEDTYGEN